MSCASQITDTAPLSYEAEVLSENLQLLQLLGEGCAHSGLLVFGNEHLLTAELACGLRSAGLVERREGN